MPRLRAAAVAVTITMLGLAGCGGDDGAQEPASESPAQESSSTSTSAPDPDSSTAPGDPMAECLVGTWTLDTVDYQNQAFAYMGGLGIPIESLNIGGEQVIEFQDRGVMSVRTDMQLDAVVFGIPLGTTSQSSGNGEWSTGANGLELENWIWGVEPTPISPDQPSVPLFDPSGDLALTDCVGDFLTLQGAGAPLIGNFVRV